MNIVICCFTGSNINPGRAHNKVQVLASMGHPLKKKNGSVFIYSNIISAANKGDAIVYCQKRFAAKMEATGSRGVQISN